MFSGIKYIFGYTDESTLDQNDTGPPSEQPNNDVSVAHSAETTSTIKLEQTLNAATTKFTEQLLPAQASIEQLQSSSHQLLPSIIEQHEEEELKKKKEGKTGGDTDLEEEEVEDGFNVESWELLDLVERADDDGVVEATSSASLNSSVHRDGAPSAGVACVVESTTSGRLNSTSNENVDASQQPDQEERETFCFEPEYYQSELVKSHGQLAGGAPSSSAQDEPWPDVAGSSPKKAEQVHPMNYARALSSNKPTTTSAPKGATAGVADGSVLNEQEAAAKATKPSKRAPSQCCESFLGEPTGPSYTIVGPPLASLVEDYTASTETVTCMGETFVLFNMANEGKHFQPVDFQPSPVERSKARKVTVVEPKREPANTEVKMDCSGSEPAGEAPMDASQSSAPADGEQKADNADWETCSDEEQQQQKPAAAKRSVYEVSPRVALVADDNESLISSGFSDCDYGFGRYNDYVMRPRKANAKRNRTVSVCKRANRLDAQARTRQPITDVASMTSAVAKKLQCGNVVDDDEVDKPELAPARNSKPKKRRPFVAGNKSSSSSSGNCHWPETIANAKGAHQQHHQQQAGGRRPASNNLFSGQTTDQKAPSTVSGGSTESSDVADMDESWFVTPPSCFTGAVRRDADDQAGRAELPRTKEAKDRENALIEHPSVYIANAAFKGQARAQRATAKSGKPGPGGFVVGGTRPTARDGSQSGATAGATSNAATTSAAVAGVSKPAAGSLITFDEDESWNSGVDDDDDDDDVTFDDEQQFAAAASGAARCRPMAAVCPPPAHQQRPQVHTTGNQFSASSGSMAPIQAAHSRPMAILNACKKGPAAAASSKQKAQAGPAAPVILKSAENQAWRNKFTVDAWDLDEHEDAESDFDNIFETSSKKRNASKRKKQRKQQAATRKADEAVDLSLAGANEIASFEDEASSSVELLSVKSLASSNEFDIQDENLAPSPSSLIADDEQQSADAIEDEETELLAAGVDGQPGAGADKSDSFRRPRTLVRPIEPERIPGWQLKRLRSKRRILAAYQAPILKKHQDTMQAAAAVSSRGSKARDESSSSASVSPSSRSTPTLIDRIGCSIVANLTNLTNGLVASGAMNCCPVASAAANERPSALLEGQESASTMANKSNSANNSAAAQAARKQLSRGALRRQNICAKQGNSLRRPDRRLKLFATPNGCSINRKVHSSIH